MSWKSAIVVAFAATFFVSAIAMAEDGASTRPAGNPPATAPSDDSSAKPAQPPKSIFDDPDRGDGKSSDHDVPAAPPPKVPGVTVSAPSAQATPIDGSARGTLLLMIKGQAVLYMNDEKVGDVGNSQIERFPVTLKDGDTLEIRAKSKFVYRAISVAFVPENGDPSPITNLHLLGDVDPEGVTADQIESADVAPAGKSDGKIETEFSGKSIMNPTIAGLPDKGKWCVFGAVIHRKT